ncbi:hypothetical protein [Tardiphaga sp. 709]|uniref:hypothetical protein n=1 Tax=Tardiphaga sp. 709 TaxID=3076039 RepID=UPI0028EE8C98|nr:hypothetical protein [Tardiphaga sp. 709]WNV09014.1 hypothetical protein RSO67_26690 [Tardiphaga sp. 709]
MNLNELTEREDEIRENYGSSVYASVLSLARLTRRIEKLATFNFLLLIFQLATLPFQFLQLRGLYPPFSQTELLFLSSIFFYMSLIALFMYERSRKLGDTIFNEVSDELQWNLINERSEFSPHERRGRPQLTIRIALRNFIAGTDLPLVAGRQGAAIYLTFNFILWAAQFAGLIYGKNSLY